MEMFNKKELDKRIGPLKKNKNLYELENVEGYVVRKCSEYGIKASYDVLAEEMPHFRTMGYTEFATCFYMQPLNLRLRSEQLSDAWYDKCGNCEKVDYAGYLIDNVLNNQANKYLEREEEFAKYPPKDNIVVLPGSNKIKTNICLNRLREIKKLHGDNVYFKPHPITTHQIIGELKDFFGEQCILPRSIDMYYYIQKAETVYTTHISESAIYAALLGKMIQPIDVWNNVMKGSFACINSYLFTKQDRIKDFVNHTFSHYKSGIIHPKVDKDWREKVDKYFNYIMAKRLMYQHWFIDDRKPKQEKK